MTLVGHPCRNYVLSCVVTWAGREVHSGAVPQRSNVVEDVATLWRVLRLTRPALHKHQRVLPHKPVRRSHSVCGHARKRPRLREDAWATPVAAHESVSLHRAHFGNEVVLRFYRVSAIFSLSSVRQHAGK